MTIYGYMRVSENDPARKEQHDALQQFGCEDIVADKITGTRVRRPAFDVLMKEVLKSGDVFVVQDVDRVGRSVKHFVDFALALKEKNISLVSLNQKIDTRNENDGLFAFCEMMARLDRDLISERTAFGMAKAKAEGRSVGRKSNFAPEEMAEMIEMRDQGKSWTKISKKLDKPITTLRSAYKSYMNSAASDLI